MKILCNPCPFLDPNDNVQIGSRFKFCRLGYKITESKGNSYSENCQLIEIKTANREARYKPIEIVEK
jgi:Fe-S-cluster containining protein